MSEERGLYGKYVVTKTEDGTEVKNCFVLRIGDDPHALMALAAYAESVERDNPLLYADLKSWLAEHNMPVGNAQKEADELRGLREMTEGIRRSVNQYRRQMNIWQDEITDLSDDVAFLLHDLAEGASTATDDAAAMRAVIEGIRDMARKVENIDGELDKRARLIRVSDLLELVSHQAADGLKNETGAALRKDLRQLEAMVDAFEKSMQETGGWRYGSDNVFAARVQRCIDHYTRMAANAVGDAHEFKDSVVAWLRGMAISAQSVSWASTHHEKDARLRGLIEVIETAISNINEQRVTDRLSRWNGVVDSWQKSDFPTREMRRRILDQEEEIKRLKKQVGESESATEAVSNGYGD